MLGKLQAGLLTLLFHHPPRAAAAKVGNFTLFFRGRARVSWAARRQALQNFEELKMSVILCTGMFADHVNDWTGRRRLKLTIIFDSGV